MRVCILACGLAALLGPGPAFAQTAEGNFPATILCDALPFPSGPMRDDFRVTVERGRGSYERKLAGGTETGSGAMQGRVLVLSGIGKSQAGTYTARYSGEVSGRGGMLTGRQSWTAGGKSYSRGCQVVIGDGRP